MPEHHFETDRPVHLYVEVGAGSVRVKATDTTTARVEVTGRDAGRVRVDLDGDDLSVVAPRATGLLGRDHHVDVVAVVPTGSDLATKTGSADLVAEGDLSLVSLKSGSGDINLDRVAGSARIAVGSGDVTVAHAQQELRVKSGSGHVELARTAGQVVVSTGSGDVEIGRSEAPVTVKTGSGDLRVSVSAAGLEFATASGDLVVDTLERGRASVTAATGEIRVGIPAGVPVWTDVSTITGRISSSVGGAGEPRDGQDHVELHATTVSGDITLSER